MTDGSGRNKFYCNDCKLRFSAYARRIINHPFCTKCGETVNVVHYEDRDKSTQKPRREWTTLEERELSRLISEKGKRPPELAKRFNRSEGSVRKKALRLGFKFD